MSNSGDRGRKGMGAAALFLAVALAALAVRALVLTELWRDLPYYRDTHPGFDQHTYDTWARQIAAGDWLSARQGVFYLTPLYPYMLAAVYALAGAGNVAAAIAMNAVFGVGAALCAAGLGRRLFGWYGGLAAGLLMAVAGSQIVWESQPLVDSLLTVICLGALWLIVELLWRSPVEAGRRRWLWALPGLLLGLASVGRASNLLVGAVMVGCVAAALGRQGRRRAVTAAAFMILGLATAVAPCAVRNGLMYGRWQVTTNGPVTLYVGNAPGATGIYAFAPHFRADEHDVRDGAYWRAKLLRELRERPLSIVPTMLRKAALFFNAWDQADNANYHFLRRELTSLRLLSVGPLALLVSGFLGVVLTAKRWRELAPLHVFGIAFAASIVAVLVAGRYKLPFYGLMAVFGGGAAVAVAERVRRAGPRALAAPALAAAVLTVLFWPRAFDERLRPLCPLRQNEFHANAKALALAGRTAQSLSMLEDGAALFPDDVSFVDILALGYLREGRPQRSLEWTERAVSRGLSSRRVLEARAVALSQLGRRQEAVEAARQVLAVWPDSEMARRVVAGALP
jgi:4-amino-4-deoxy-L-arabinose transferase-like glycosyltransferase